METTRTNSMRRDERSFRKGEYGELLIQAMLEKNGYVVYRTNSNGSHGFDMTVYKNGRYVFAVEVKTKRKCNKYPETGFEEYLFQRYERLSKELNLPVFIAFVDEGNDEVKGAIYGNWLTELNKPIHYQRWDYPKVRGHTGGQRLTRYFPMCHMRHLRYLTCGELAILKTIGKSNRRLH